MSNFKIYKYWVQIVLGFSWVLVTATHPFCEIPIPAERQIHFQRNELVLFVHFGVNTFTDLEWGTGLEDPDIFQPTNLNTSQWIETAALAGFTQVILTAKHHDGFMLYPNPFTDHSVASSSWENGQGDVVRAFVESCELLGVEPAFYLSPWDMNQYPNGTLPTQAYNDFYTETLIHLSTNYGVFYQLWWDGAPGGHTDYYDWHSWLPVLRKYQPEAVGGGCGDLNNEPDCGPDTSWIGNEGGIGHEQTWSSHQASSQFPDPNGCDVYAPHFAPVSIRPGWFYHQNEDVMLKTLPELVEIYFQTVGYNCGLHLNIPPNRDGLFAQGDVERLIEFGRYIENTFSVDSTDGGVAEGSSSLPGHEGMLVLDGLISTWWEPEAVTSLPRIQIKLVRPSLVNVIMMQEHIANGQKIAKYQIELTCIEANGGAHKRDYVEGTTIGYKKLNQFPSQLVTDITITILETLQDASPQIQRVGLFFALPIS